MQILTIAGNVGKDATLKEKIGGEPVLNFSLAVDNGKDRDGQKREATWYECALWGKRAMALEPHITKGSKLTLSGKPTVRVFDGKAYLGITVSELTFMGGGNRDDAAEPRREYPPVLAAARDVLGRGPANLDMGGDDIPWSAEVR